MFRADRNLSNHAALPAGWNRFLLPPNPSLYSAYTFFDLLDVAQHFAARPVFVVPFDRGDNPAMGVDGCYSCATRFAAIPHGFDLIAPSSRRPAFCSA